MVTTLSIRFHPPARAFSRCLSLKNLKNRFSSSDPTHGGKNRGKVVVLGTGWASYSFLKTIDRSKFDVTVVSPRNYFLFTPLLASTTVGTLEFRSIIEPVRNIGFKDAEMFHLAHATSVDTTENVVNCRSWVKDDLEYSLPFDKLVIGVGCLSNTFNIPGVQQHALFLKEIQDAQAIRNRIVSNFELALEPGLSIEEKQRLLHFVIVGGGPTGVEFGAELYDFLLKDVARLYESEKNLVRVSLIEAQKILPSFDSKLQAFAEKKLKTREQYSLVQDQVINVTDKFVDLKSGKRIDCGLVVWSAGLAPRDLTQCLSWAEKNKAGQIVTDRKLNVFNSQEKASNERVNNKIFAIGDCADVVDYPLPCTAQVAERQGRHLAKCFNKGSVDDFSFTSAGMLAYIGGYEGLTDMPKVKLSGWVSWFVWRSAYLTRLGSWRLRMQVPLDWTKPFIYGRDTSRL